MKTKEEILNGLYPGIGNECRYPLLVENAMQEYSDQQNAEFICEIEHLKGEQRVLVERISQLTPYKKEGI